MVTVATGTLVEPAHAQQMQQVDGVRAADEIYPLWARPYLSPGFNAGSYTANQLTYTTKLGAGTVGLFLQSDGRDGGAGVSGTSGNLLGPLFGGPTSLRQDWVGASLANPAWRTSVFGSYKSEANAGLYTTASFGLASIRTNPSGFSGLTNFSTGNDAVGLTASAGVGVQLTPQISIEGGFTWTQAPASSFR
jgi:hypothetical protein